jgi:polar amino acid transport system substrate-binding protein
MKKITFAVLALVALALVLGCAPASKKIIVATDATWPPMEYVNDAKEIVGFDVDLIKAVAAKAGFEVEIKNQAWDGIFAGLAAKKYDAVISSVTITDERKATMDFSDPYINAGQVLIVKSALQGVETLDALKGKKVGAQIGTTGAMAIEKVAGVELKNYDELGLAIEDLYNGRIEGVVADTPIAANFVLQTEKYKGSLKIVGKPFTDEYYGIALNKKNAALLKKINKALGELVADGTVQKLETQWLR